MRGILFLCLVASSVGDARAQSSPADLADMSLAELTEVEFVPDMEGVVDHHRFGWGRWHLGYRYLRVKFDGYRDGTDRVDNDEILGAPPGPNRFPVLPTEIIQEAHLFQFSYDLFSSTSVSLVLPYIRQRTDHVSVVPNYDRFTIMSDGIGDLSLSVSQTLFNQSFGRLMGSLGVSFPTGSINEKGDTPRDSGMDEEQLPYTMQLGSGTYDVLLSATYAGEAEPLPALRWLGRPGWGAQAFGKIRTGENSRGYRLGHLVLLSGWLSAQPFSWLEATLRVRSQIWRRIHGSDPALELAPGVYPAPVTNPALFGGEKVALLGGVRLGWPEGWLSGGWNRALRAQEIEIEGGSPVYQNLNGPQPEEDYRLTVAWNLNF